MILGCTSAASAQITQVYSFEPDLEGFVFNGGGVTVSLETSGLGATDGLNSMKLDYTDFSSFAGAKTANIHPAFNDPLGVDFVRFDFTNTNRFAPPPTDPPTPGVPTFANTSITFFGELPGNPVTPAQIQFFLSEEAVGNLEPGTHEIEVDLTMGGLNVDTGDIKGYDEYIADGFVPGEFQIYINKSFGFGDPDFAWTVYIDNIRVGRVVAGVPGDYNEDGSVDAADYVVWRKASDLMLDDLPNDNDGDGPVGAAEYALWRENFGGPLPGGGSSLGPVPEPASALLMILAAAGSWARNWGRMARYTATC
ncbi:MAG: PEP-CTERM sorting domain-containing protein [Verrucomicrobia subdivision 3 bacterium]|nr:PEP-CTERM sorting domain-containing protein [Limisphaerales bacterium]